ncbi:MAG: hypothetical protein VXV96_13640 [Bdellovibrionota bacterium]|nr:hypothetical protein [Bdellovibrionota bacterium]
MSEIILGSSFEELFEGGEDYYANFLSLLSDHKVGKYDFLGFSIVKASHSAKGVSVGPYGFGYIKVKSIDALNSLHENTDSPFIRLLVTGNDIEKLNMKNLLYDEGLGYYLEIPYKKEIDSELYIEFVNSGSGNISFELKAGKYCRDPGLFKYDIIKKGCGAIPIPYQNPILEIYDGWGPYFGETSASFAEKCDAYSNGEISKAYTLHPGMSLEVSCDGYNKKGI